MKENRHSIIVHCQFEKVYPEIIRWGEAAWWPKNSLMCFVRQDQGDVHKGTRYRQRVLLSFAPSWDVEVEHLDERSITRRFLNGMFKGSETVSVEPCGEEIKVQYVMNYQINGMVNKILWTLIFEKLHNRNITAILQNLKNYLEAKD